MLLSRVVMTVPISRSSSFVVPNHSRQSKRVLDRAIQAGAKCFSSSPSEYSQRGLDAVDLLPSYLADARQVEKYNPSTCPNGALQLGVAENQLMEHVLVPALTEMSRDAAFTADCIYYQPTQGRPGLRSAMARYLERTLKLSNSMDEEGIIVGAGCNAVLENLCFCLASQGDAVLIPTPYYAAFEFDLVARAGLSIQPVTTFDYQDVNVDAVESIPPEAYYPNRESLNAAYEQAQSKGHQPRILLLSHPNNPLGVCYPPHVVKECIDWCRQHEVHLVSDEIYAGSVFHGNFSSAMELGSSDDKFLGLGPYVHLVYALSKDFGLSGLRVGACYSENRKIRLPLQKLNDLGQISSQTQALVERMLTKKDETFWTDDFLIDARNRIRERCNALEGCLDRFDIPYLEAKSGLFLWMDFRQFLPSDPAGSDQERERSLYLKLVNEFGLLFTPGLSMRTERPGFFRFVFTAATNDEFALSLERLQKFALAHKE